MHHNHHNILSLANRCGAPIKDDKNQSIKHLWKSCVEIGFLTLRAKEPMMNKQPSIKEMANFCRNITISGRNMKKTMKRKHMLQS
jgi:hypothetical protein